MALRLVSFSSAKAFRPVIQYAVQTRGMATEKQLSNQIKSTTNIRKITSSMKMVSAAKLKGDEQRLKNALPFNAWTERLVGEAQMQEGATYEELPAKCLLVPFTSDKGLCGGINTFMTRGARECGRSLIAQDKQFDIAVIGDKGRGQLKRLFADHVSKSMTGVVSPGSYGLAAALASDIIAAGGASDYDAVVLMFNSYVNPAVYKQKYIVIKPLKWEGVEDEPLQEYEFEPDSKHEILVDLYEYMLSTQVYYCFMDGATSEQSARMAAMENATKNAGELIDKLTLQYNRARQARITTELIEIISGASALEG